MARSFNELKNRKSAEAREQVGARVEEIGHLNQLIASDGEAAVTKCGARILPDHSALRAQMSVLNISSADLLRENRNDR